MYQYQNNPYIGNMPADVYGCMQPEYMYGNYNYMPEYMNIGVQPGYPMPSMKSNPYEFSKPYQMEKMYNDQKCVKIPEVIGRNQCSVLLEHEIPFAPGHPALEIKDIVKEVKELVLAVCKDRVLINGMLHKNINYKTLEGTGKFTCGCNDIELAYGDLRHVHVAMPFSAHMEIPGARPGDSVEIEYAGVEDDCELDILIDQCFVKGCEMPVYKKVKEKVLVKIDLKVLRPCQITIDPQYPNICR